MSHVTQPLITLLVLAQLLSVLIADIRGTTTPPSYAFWSEGEKAQKLSQVEYQLRPPIAIFSCQHTRRLVEQKHCSTR